MIEYLYVEYKVNNEKCQGWFSSGEKEVEREGRAEEVGFEPTKAIHLTRFPVVLTRPL